MLTLILGLGNIGKKYDKTRHNLGFEVVDRVVEKLGAVRQEDGECYQWWKGEMEGADGDVGVAQQKEERLLRSDEAPDARNDVPLVSVRGSHSKLRGTVPRQGEDEEGLLRRAEDAASRNDDVGGAGARDGGSEAERVPYPKGWATKRSIYLAKPTTYMNGSGEAAKELIEKLGVTPADILVVVDDFQIPLGAVRFRPSGSDGGHNGLVSVIEELGTQEFPRLRLGIGLPPEPGQAGRKPAAHKKDQAQVIDYVLTKFTPDEKPAVEKMLANAAEGVIFALQHRLEKVMSKYNFNPAPENLA